MHCTVHASDRRDHLYLYLRGDVAFDDLPDTLRAAFGPPRFVMELALTPDRPLARESASEVIENLKDQGFHVQMPPSENEGEQP